MLCSLLKCGENYVHFFKEIVFFNQFWVKILILRKIRFFLEMDQFSPHFPSLVAYWLLYTAKNAEKKSLIFYQIWVKNSHFKGKNIFLRNGPNFPHFSQFCLS